MRIQQFDYVIAKILLNTIIICVGFNISNIKQYLKILAVFYTVISINIGVNIFITQMFNISINSLISKIITYIGGGTLSYLVFKWLWKTYKNNMTQKDYIYKVKVRFNNEDFIYKGFLDTGNSLKDILSNKYVIFAKKNNELSKYLYEKDRLKINIVTIGNKEIKEGWIFKDIEIEINKKIINSEAVIVFDDTNLWDGKQFDMILNYEFMKEIGGIEI